MKKIIVCLMAALLFVSSSLLMFCSCKQSELYSEGDGDLNVLCTIFPTFDLAREVGGDKVTLTLLQDSGADLHNYTPTSATLNALAKADVFIYVGGVSDEAWVYDAIKASGNKDVITLCLMDSINQIHAELENDWSEHDHADGEHSDSDQSHTDSDHSGHDHSGDEHIWTSLKNAAIMVDEIREVFIVADGANADYYENRANDYTAKLNSLDSSLEGLFSGDIPTVVFADRFPFVYLFHDYHIPYIAAFSGCSTEVNASFETQIKLIDAVNNGSLDCIFTIEGGSKTLAQTISNETGCSIVSLDSMQSVTRSDIENGVTYLSIMKKNVDVLLEVFG